jgi:hypothetical protein
MLMLEEKERVVSLLKEVMKELGMNKKGRVTFHLSGFDYAALSEHGEPVTPSFCPRWALRLNYPTDGSERSRVFSVDIVTYDFQREEEIKNFMLGEIKSQMANLTSAAGE